MRSPPISQSIQTLRRPLDALRNNRAFWFDSRHRWSLVEPPFTSRTGRTVPIPAAHRVLKQVLGARCPVVRAENPRRNAGLGGLRREGAAMELARLRTRTERFQDGRGRALGRRNRRSESAGARRVWRSSDVRKRCDRETTTETTTIFKTTISAIIKFTDHEAISSSTSFDARRRTAGSGAKEVAARGAASRAERAPFTSRPGARYRPVRARAPQHAKARCSREP